MLPKLNILPFFNDGHILQSMCSFKTAFQSYIHWHKGCFICPLVTIHSSILMMLMIGLSHTSPISYLYFPNGRGSFHGKDSFPTPEL